MSDQASTSTTDETSAPTHNGEPATTVNPEPEAPKPTETVDFWKQKAREQEKRAKDNAEAAKRLAELEDAKKSEAERAADRIAKAEAEVASVPSKVADALKEHLVTLHKISGEDAELFLTATDPELLLKQITRLLERNEDSGKPRAPRPDPTQGRVPNGAPLDPRSADLAQIEADLKAAQRR